MILDFSARLTTVRERSGISMNRLAKLAGLSQPFISELESGRKQPTLDTMEKICHALGLSLSEFFAGDVQGIPPDLRLLLQEAEGLTPGQRKNLTEFIKAMKGR